MSLTYYVALPFVRTEDGSAAMTKAYYVGVGRAIAQGKQVRDEIRQAYNAWLSKPKAPGESL